MQPKRKPRKIIRRRSTPIADSFSYTEIDVLRQCLSEQGAILTRPETGLSQKMQRSMTIAVKRARHLAMLPFTQTL
ncbi:MAG: 30S ribosomal protein S18 [Candidatus Pacebacteria bacterium RIFCSPLOWO2_01_FULL_47_12]|nr:MAG: 30S ribosomal protein S18 [Candidatus Pacebacteria bacterium RIFCSPHIGHO2_02_FULL_46_9]OGJ37996.1 MAG: 30S ribosomal protein S18 [Candidatus Pacebacteria bacterium RIFCSPLOWO2_01_FULL_47_12]